MAPAVQPITDDCATAVGDHAAMAAQPGGHLPLVPIYEDMKEWVIDRTAAKARAEEPDLSPDIRLTRERYCEWLDSERPDWLNDMPPRDEAA